MQLSLEDANAKARVSQSRFEDFTRASSDWIWETDADGRFTYFSENMANLIGRKTSDLVGLTREDLCGEDVQSSKWSAHQKRLEERRPFRNFEYSLLDSSGKKVYVSTSGVPVFDLGHHFLGYRGIGQDI